MSGGQAGAENGQLTVMCGGDDEAFYELARPVMGAYAKACSLMGPAGAGQLTKMVNQICIAGIVQGLAEGSTSPSSAGLDPDQVIDVIRYGAAQSWQMENRARTMARGEFEFGFAVEWMRKDLGDRARRGQPQRCPPAGDRTDRPVLRPGDRPRRHAVGTRPA